MANVLSKQQLVENSSELGIPTALLPWNQKTIDNAAKDSIFLKRWGSYAIRCGRRGFCQQLYTKAAFKKLIKEISNDLNIKISENANDLLKEAGMEHLSTLLDAAEISSDHDGRNYITRNDFLLASRLTRK